ncbi:hypothetical protein OPT61_g9253 [Boeremia exigua]|uniref:Uncharacterized protein n=1 Tax=Boeremia exigua TaxID=749465 RepID=A0ACC2HUW2_9PLEO|nr:hypothetical protein OPT61_g9253 [Boeremia exigua]
MPIRGRAIRTSATTALASRKARLCPDDIHVHLSHVLLLLSSGSRIAEKPAASLSVLTRKSRALQLSLFSAIAHRACSGHRDIITTEGRGPVIESSMTAISDNLHTMSVPTAVGYRAATLREKPLARQ